MDMSFASEWDYYGNGRSTRRKIEGWKCGYGKVRSLDETLRFATYLIFDTSMNLKNGNSRTFTGFIQEIKTLHCASRTFHTVLLPIRFFLNPLNPGPCYWRLAGWICGYGINRFYFYLSYPRDWNFMKPPIILHIFIWWKSFSVFWVRKKQSNKYMGGWKTESRAPPSQITPNKVRGLLQI